VPFANDGSFMAKFKRMKEEKERKRKEQEAADAAAQAEEQLRQKVGTMCPIHQGEPLYFLFLLLPLRP